VDRFAQDKGLLRDEAWTLSIEEAEIQRFGQPEEIAAVVAFLCSEHATYIHGVSLDVDGGATRGIEKGGSHRPVLVNGVIPPRLRTKI
jgi:3-oxoacyl-[acyl-carrier protein] reductase